MVPEAIAEFRGHPNAAQLLRVCIDVLGRNPTHPHQGKAGLMRGHEPIRKFRPPGFGALRIYYAIDGDHPDVVWLLGVHPRGKDHRTKDLHAAGRRLKKAATDDDGGRHRAG